MNTTSALVWFRRDLRHYDHAALSLALQRAQQVYCVFVFDTDILQALPGPGDRRVEFILASVQELQTALYDLGGGLMVLHGSAATLIPELVKTLGVKMLFANQDYEPAAQQRDARVAAQLEAAGIPFIRPKDQVIFAGSEILTQQGKPYTVFTPYQKTWRQRLQQQGSEACLAPYPVNNGQEKLVRPPQHTHIPSLKDLGFSPTNFAQLAILPGMSGAAQTWEKFQEVLPRYHLSRDFPGRRGVSYLSVHLRFGTLSIRELVRAVWPQEGKGPETWLSELIWREFYFMLLAAFPHVVHAAFKPEFDALVWENWPDGLTAWQEGRTGYPIVDAAMRQLNQTGYMHNRLRMITASFLTKDLGISWQAGEQYFADHLNDFDLSANNGGWQWAASTGCDAQPWFRIFNPVTQSEKFDPDGTFIRRYVPELKGVPLKYLHAPWTMPPLVQQASKVLLGRDYPLPIVDHAQAREKTLERFKGLKR